MRPFLFFLVLLTCITATQAQSNRLTAYGFQHLKTIYKGDTVDILIKSKKGEEQNPKPLFLFCQGSLPKPLFIYSKEGPYGVFPFNTDSLVADYHLAIISKPFIPVEAEAGTLGEEFTYKDSTGTFPKNYSLRNQLDYYVDRNIQVIKYLQQQPWISSERLVIAGHSEGSTVVAKLAITFPKVTHVIYAAGNPLGRITSIITTSRQKESDSIQTAENDLECWKEIVDNPSATYPPQGDSYKTMYDFSQPPIQYLQQIKVPVLITYGTKDAGTAPFNDYLRIEMIRQHKTNFTFKAYINAEHNFFKVKPGGIVDYNDFGWNKVATGWLQWLRQH
jgi:dienelactone hydrolase